jgi:nuclear transport factor 2 (NTF2) superfamily protein
MDPEKIVEEVEAAYQSQNVDRIMELFHPEIVFYWNGKKRGEGFTEVRTAHEEMFGDRNDDYEIDKTLRAASGDTIAVEWTTSWIDPDGNYNEGYGGEFWTMEDGQLIEWHAYHKRYAHDDADDVNSDAYLDHH